MSAEYPPKSELESRASAGDPVAQQALGTRKIQTGPHAAIPGQTRPKGRRMSGTILRLAQRLGKDPDELAREIPEDTVRRTKYGVVEDRQQDGSILFKQIPVE